MKKKILMCIIIFIVVILLFPIPLRLKDGGSIEFKAILYSITKYHQINNEVDGGYVDGIGIEILGIKVLDTRTKKTKTITMTEERTKLEDLEINADGVDTAKLVRFNDTLYGKSYVVIDFAGDMSRSIGKIDFLIEEEYLPIIEGETNCQEFYGANVLEINEKSMILNVDNVAVLFEKIDREAMNEESFCGTIVEATISYIIVVPNEDEAIRSSSDKISIGLGEYNDALYEVGTKVKITYDGDIMESYPARVKATKIEVQSTKNFEMEN